LKVSSNAVVKIIKLYDETGAHKDCQRKGRPRVTSAAEDKFIRVICTLDCSPNKCFT
jgi:transposase